MLDRFFDCVQGKLREVKENERDPMVEAGEVIADCVAVGGIVHLFGCGHSHLLAAEAFYRAGGLAPVHPIFVEDLMLHRGALRSSRLEREDGLAAELMKDVKIEQQDVMIVISTSGINPVPIEVARIAKDRGARVIGLTSRVYSSRVSTRHKEALRLLDVVDLVLDNHVDEGDAMLGVEGIPVRFGPSSTIVGACILHGVFAHAIQLLLERGTVPPLFQSGNLPGSEEGNQRLIQRYADRIPLLLDR
ncbi:SIS domain-containing protein [Desmospora profundinema]|uniref:UPF0309 protein JOE21_000106 n=1 Tax=Desmospora profundinema TaxID=1571184 RepID=A0ABU1IIA0_9BACL|nr:SIS domain-containing protein [Desmospora profundinema]MDR6224118.1 putative phosphosugar-binding protein [Desmospora profundinema]